MVGRDSSCHEMVERGDVWKGYQLLGNSCKRKWFERIPVAMEWLLEKMVERDTSCQEMVVRGNGLKGYQLLWNGCKRRWLEGIPVVRKWL